MTDFSEPSEPVSAVRRWRWLGFDILAPTLLPLVLAWLLLGLRRVDFLVPVSVDRGDGIWQLTLTKALLDNGWILNNPYMGAPDVAHWYVNPAAQQSAFHSVLMLGLGLFFRDAVTVQQVYYVANFSLITTAAYVACRVFGAGRFMSLAAGLLFAFIPYRFTLTMYAFLPNYFMVPLMLMAPIFILTRRFVTEGASGAGPRRMATTLRGLLGRWDFLASCVILAVGGAADGYYAFFTLLLLLYASGVRAIAGDIRRPTAFIAPAMLCVALVLPVLLLSLPLRLYEHRHKHEFYPNGVMDTALFKHPSEAEVYSSSLLQMFAPEPSHRVPVLAALGERLMEIHNEPRRMPGELVSALGILGSLLLAALLGCVATAIATAGEFPFRRSPVAEFTSESKSTLAAMAALASFIVLTSISGGLGPLIALLYPTIRGYDRFPVLLMFLLFAGAALVISMLAGRSSRAWRLDLTIAVPAVVGLALYDQTPPHPFLWSRADAPRFRTERAFVQGIEATLPDDAMVYQFPYSQYMIDSPYYGQGSFAHMRLYLHSHHIRWSNGASKNSPVESWHNRMSELPTDQLVTELEAVGFRGFVVDRSVVHDAQYTQLRAAMIARTGQAPVEGDKAQLAYWPLSDPGYTLTYDPSFETVSSITVRDPAAVGRGPLSRTIDRAALLAAMDKVTSWPQTFSMNEHPDLVINTKFADWSHGLRPISPLAAFRGDVACAPETVQPLSVSRDTLGLRVTNRSAFDWHLNTGTYSIRVGLMELLDGKGNLLRWDSGLRAPGNIDVPSNGAVDIRFPLSKLDLKTGLSGAGPDMTAVFALVQESVAWFAAPLGHAECRVRVVP